MGGGYEFVLFRFKGNLDVGLLDRPTNFGLQLVDFYAISL
jgi:hypothetical protein